MRDHWHSHLHAEAGEVGELFPYRDQELVTTVPELMLPCMHKLPISLP